MPKAIEKPTVELMPMNKGALDTVQPQSVSRVKAHYQEAIIVAKPRDLDLVVKNVFREASHAGKSFFYSWTVKGKGGKALVEGPTIGLAQAVFREWGNCTYFIEEEDHGDYWLFSVVPIDLETGVTMPRLMRWRKSSTKGQYDDQRKLDMSYQSGQSRAIRNAILQIPPRWLIDQAIAKAKTSAAKNVNKNDILKLAVDVRSFFEKLGISKERFEARLDVPFIKLGQMDIVELESMKQAVIAGETNAEDLFPAEEIKPVVNLSEMVGKATVEANPHDEEKAATAVASAPVNEPVAPASTLFNEPEVEDERGKLITSIDVSFEKLDPDKADGILNGICAGVELTRAGLTRAGIEKLRTIAGQMAAAVDCSE